jgi:hypothetical protein
MGYASGILYIELRILFHQLYEKRYFSPFFQIVEQHYHKSLNSDSFFSFINFPFCLPLGKYWVNHFSPKLSIKKVPCSKYKRHKKKTAIVGLKEKRNDNNRLWLRENCGWDKPHKRLYDFFVRLLLSSSLLVCTMHKETSFFCAFVVISPVSCSQRKMKVLFYRFG